VVVGCDGGSDVCSSDQRCSWLAIAVEAMSINAMTVNTRPVILLSP